jgi:hypothetical protein
MDMACHSFRYLALRAAGATEPVNKNETVGS